MVEEVQVVNVQPVSRSPVPNKKPNELSFPDAMREILNGKKITRLAWESNSDFGELKQEGEDAYLMIFTRGEYHRWIINSGDINATDWVTLPEQGKE